MEKKGDLSDFEHEIVVFARRGGLSISKTADLLGFSRTTVSIGFTENGQKKRKYPVSGSCVDKNALLMSEVRGECRLVRDDRKATVTQMTTRY